MPKRQIYFGLFLISLATLMYEILLTRIFSVTTSYHFAFMAVSIAMFGMSLGALLVYLCPKYFSYERVFHHLTLYSLLFGLSLLASFLVYLRIPPGNDILGRLFSTTLIYAVISIPFVFSGVCVCLALTKFPGHVSRLYAADLAGAGIGCVLILYVLRITDGPTAVIVVASLACLGSVFFAVDPVFKTVKQTALVFTLLLAAFGSVNAVFVFRQTPLLRLTWVKGQLENPPLYEKWSPFSRVAVFGDPHKTQKPIGWGFGPACPCDKPISQLAISIDASAETVLTFFDDNLDNLEYLKYDVTNVVHQVRHPAKVLIVGTGGGRDILSALVFSQKSILGVEINRDIIMTANRIFGRFTGYLDRNPKVTIINDEARSYTARSRDKFDIIQVSFVDTWAAAASGAFALTENSLYTVDAWKLFLRRLEPRGVLSFSRWYVEESPVEMYRLTALAVASLKESGVENPRPHIVIVKNPQPSDGMASPAVGTLLMSRQPFSAQDLDTIHTVAKNMGFSVVLDATLSLDNTFAGLAAGKDFDEVIARFPLNIAPSTDNNPFFFNMSRFQDMFNDGLRPRGRLSSYLQPSYILGSTLLIALALTLLCIIFPLVLRADRPSPEDRVFFIFFVSVGLGFMLIEISLLQRLSIFLGHPTYTLSVILFTLLASSSCGSYLTKRINIRPSGHIGVLCIFLVVLTLAVFGKLIPMITSLFEEAGMSLRVAIVSAALFPIGVFMGMPFPLGMKLASERSERLSPWLWGLNGAASVFGSVLAATIALNSGISSSFWTGVLCYLVAFLTFFIGIRSTTASKRLGGQLDSLVKSGLT